MLNGWQVKMGYYSGHKLLVAESDWDYSEMVYKTIDIDGSTANSFAGIAESGTLNTLVDSDRTEPDDYFIGDRLTITAGTGVGQKGIILDYDSDGTFHFASNTFATPPEQTSQYSIDPGYGDTTAISDQGLLESVMSFAPGTYRIFYGIASSQVKYINIDYGGLWSQGGIASSSSHDDVRDFHSASSKDGKTGIFVYLDADDSGRYIIYKK